MNDGGMVDGWCCWHNKVNDGHFDDEEVISLRRCTKILVVFGKVESCAHCP
jgi:hypothetical protein